MGDYIKREDMLKVARSWICTAGVKDDLESIPSADVVEVVRCEECKKWHDSHKGDGYGVCDYMTALTASDTDIETHKSWYCAKSKEEEHE